MSPQAAYMTSDLLNKAITGKYSGYNYMSQAFNGAGYPVYGKPELLTGMIMLMKSVVMPMTVGWSITQAIIRLLHGTASIHVSTATPIYPKLYKI